MPPKVYRNEKTGLNRPDDPEIREFTRRLAPRGGHLFDPGQGGSAVKPGDEILQDRPLAFDADFDPAVAPVADPPPEAQLRGRVSGVPAESHSLDAAGDKGMEAGGHCPYFNTPRGPV